MLALSLIVFLAVLASATSNFLTSVNPDLALSFNPLNTQARVNKLSTQLARKLNPAELAGLRMITTRGIELDPMDARLYSLLGVLDEQQGNNETAQQLYIHSLKLLPTEIQALTRRFVFNVNAKNYVDAVSHADIILRRWNSQWKLIKPYMAGLLQDKAAYQEALLRFSKNEYVKTRLIGALTNNVNSTVIARRLVKDWHAQGVKNLRPIINNVTRKLINYNRHLSAYRLFLLTLNDAEMAEVGYIFNSNFNLKPSGSLFDWQLVTQAGISTQIRQFYSENADGQTKSNVYEFRFLDAPIRLSKILQHLVLPPSNFTLNLVYSSLNLKTGKPIKLQVGCRKRGLLLASLSFEAGNTNKKKETLNFKVPATDCKILLLRIYNENIVESWKNRYSGSLLIHNITVSLNGA